VTDAPLTPESAKAIADQVIEQEVVPKKIPAIEDIEGQTAALGGALSAALLTCTDKPIHTLAPIVGDLAHQLVALGIRQTDCIDPSAWNVPTWVVDGMRQKSVKLPDPPQHTTAPPVVVRTGTAPPCPKHIPDAARAVRR
jgi:hypothetical protein